MQFPEVLSQALRVQRGSLGLEVSPPRNWQVLFLPSSTVQFAFSFLGPQSGRCPDACGVSALRSCRVQQLHELVFLLLHFAQVQQVPLLPVGWHWLFRGTHPLQSLAR